MSQGTEKAGQSAPKARQGAAKFEIGFGPNSKFQWKLYGPDNKEVLASQPYGNKDQAFEGIRDLKANAPFPERCRRGGEKDALHFKVLSASHVVLATSANFAKEEDLELAISVVRRSPEAAVMDKTTG